MKSTPRSFFILLTLFADSHRASAQGLKAFTDQGRLLDGGTNVNGNFNALEDFASLAAVGTLPKPNNH